MSNAQQKSQLGAKPEEHVQPVSPTDVRQSGGTLDLNRASEAEIAEIDMIGKKLAHAIVERRAVQGSIESWEELRAIPGLDAMKIAELQRAAHLSKRS
jgi:DNA uptake protein ComE-like DNA-binding protein